MLDFICWTSCGTGSDSAKIISEGEDKSTYWDTV
jgi:hypothetical protein